MKKGKGSAKQILLLLLILIALIVIFYYFKQSDIITPTPEPNSDNCGCSSTTFGCCPDGTTVRNYDGSSCIQPLHGWNDDSVIEGFSSSSFKELKKCVNNCVLTASDYQGGGNDNGENQYNGGGNDNGIYHGGNNKPEPKPKPNHNGGGGGEYNWLNGGNVPVWNPNPKQHQTWKPYGKNKPGDCHGTQYGCCWNGTPKNADGSNCPAPKGNCRQAPYGCCPDGVTGKNGPDGANCSPFTPNPKSPAACARVNYGCCPDGKEVRKRRVIRGKDKKIVRTVYGENCYGIFI